MKQMSRKEKWKKEGRGKAYEIYDGPLWQTFRTHEKGNHRIMVISAKYGLIPADKVISSYDCLLGRDKTDSVLAHQIKRQLKRYRLKNVYVVASKRYAAVLRKAGLSNFHFVSGGIGVKREKLRGLL